MKIEINRIAKGEEDGLHDWGLEECG